MSEQIAALVALAEHGVCPNCLCESPLTSYEEGFHTCSTCEITFRTFQNPNDGYLDLQIRQPREAFTKVKKRLLFGLRGVTQVPS